MATPLRYENVGEEWLIIELVFNTEGKEMLKITGSFLRDKELRRFIEDLQQLVINNVKGEVESSFLEPNFSSKITKLSDNEFEVEASFLEKIEYETGEIKRNSVKNLSFMTNKDKIISFCEGMESAIQHIAS